MQSRSKNKLICTALALTIFILVGSVIDTPSLEKGVYASGTFSAENVAASSNAPDASANSLPMDSDPFYAEVYSDWIHKGYENASDTYRIHGADMYSQSPQQLAEPGDFQGKERVLIWKNDRDSWIEYKVKVDQAGLFQLNLQYYP
ncbi:hypothetical protein, partial [Paenibacillus eucommiae]